MTMETTGTAPTAGRSERPRFFARTALVMAVIVLLSFPVTYYLPVATGALIAATNGGGVFRSTDDGQQWTRVDAGLSNPNV